MFIRQLPALVVLNWVSFLLLKLGNCVFHFANTHFSARTNVIETTGGLGSVNVVYSHPDSSLHLALLGKFLLGHPRDDGPLPALPSLFLRCHPAAHRTHQERDVQTLNHPQNLCGLHPLMIVHVFSSLPR